MTIENIIELYGLKNHRLTPVPGHDGGRNRTYICGTDSDKQYVLRISDLDDRTENDYLAEMEFVRYLSDNGAPVAAVIPSGNGRIVERIEWNGKPAYVSLFEYAKGILISDNGYRYREGAPLSEYFYNTGKAFGIIHQLSKEYRPEHRRIRYFDKYNMDYIGTLIPDAYSELKGRIAERQQEFKALPQDKNSFGLVHFDFSDGNYHIDMATDDITVFDFDNCMYCWYLLDLANLWTHGVGWCRFEEDAEKRRACMTQYFDTILAGYRTETDVSAELLAKLPLFIDMVLIENIVDAFECCARAGETMDDEDIQDAAESLIRNIPYAGFLT